MKGEILKLLYIYSLNKRIFDKTAIEILNNIFINNNYDIEKYFKKIIITNEDDIVALYSQEKNSIIKFSINYFKFFIVYNKCFSI